jgi:flagellar motor component MotA
METSDISKKIIIHGTNNKYQINKYLNKKNIVKEPKKRIVTEKWSFSDKYFDHNDQMKLIYNILNKIEPEPELELEEGEKESIKVTKILIQEINKKISGYRQQDIHKKKLNINEFITFESIIEKMIECKLKCRYCNENMNVLYDISRESKQWSVDRIDNDLGHNINNYHLACLDCNLKRRRRTDEKFLFTKQLKLVKKDKNQI